MRSRIFQVLMLSLVLTTYAFGQDKKNEPPKTGRIIIGGPNQNIPTTPSGTKEDPALKAKRREQMYKRKISREVSKANARQTANAVAAAGSQMVAEQVQRANDARIESQQFLNSVNGRQSTGELSRRQIQSAQSLLSGLSSISSSERTSSSSNSASKINLWECVRCKRQHQSKDRPILDEKCPKFRSILSHDWVKR